MESLPRMNGKSVFTQRVNGKSVFRLTSFISFLIITGYLLFLSHESLSDCKHSLSALQSGIERQRELMMTTPRPEQPRLPDPYCSEACILSGNYFIYDVHILRKVPGPNRTWTEMNPSLFPLIMEQLKTQHNFTALARIKQICV